MRKRAILFLLLLCSLCSCQKEQNTPFSLLKSTSTGIDFANELRYTETINAYTYRNFYNGAGVATGDINNDGLIDLYFAGNQVDNKIYLNQGNFKFEDITLSSGLSCSGVWTTGVSMADINGDGWLDIYVCKSGPQGGKNRYNELFINNGDLTFTEKAKEYGLNDEGLSTHAAFFDYDKDGDLDIYLLNNSGRSVGLYDLREGQREIRDSLGSNKLYRNDGDYFSDVSELAGIYGSSIGYGLGVTIADLNRDGWQDIYVSNDFFERDYLYFNNGDGTFTESLEEVINEISIGSMGADIADLTNDGFPEIYVTEMLPDRWDRVKTKALFENWDKYQANVSNGYYHQFSRNVLQLNNGFIPNDTNESVHFSEIARFTNLYATDWSWGALIFDYNNDGNKDIFVANGVGKDLTDQDYINYYANNNVELTKARRDSTLLTNLMDKIPSEALPNYLFHNYGDLRFENKAKDLGLDQKTFSNGAAYADLDNDGDMDLVVNNIDAPASVYRNNTSELENTNYIQIALSGKGRNSAAFGTQIEVYAGGQYYFSEQTPVKGYMSSVDPRIHFGLDQSAVVDSIVVTWPDATTSRLYNVNSNQIIELDQREVDVQQKNREPSESSTWFTEQSKIFKTYTHTENSFVDFNRDQLLFEMFSNEGPVSATADVNEDGLTDLYIGGSKDQMGQLLLQTTSGNFLSSNIELFRVDSKSEDSDALFIDIDQDGDMDLFVASGGNEFTYGSVALQNRLYINDGSGIFTKAPRPAFSSKNESTGFIKSIDFDGDGDNDIITGTRLIPFAYGVPANAYIYENDGLGNFKDITQRVAPEFTKLGLLTDAAVTDFDGDGDEDILICGEWMPIQAFVNNNGRFALVTSEIGFSESNGLWNTIESADLDNDGLEDIIVGNHGLNTRFKASVEDPLTMIVNDFDQNGSVEQVICYHDSDSLFPMVLLQDLTKQMPFLRKRFTNFDTYKDKSLGQIFTQEELSRALTLEVKTLESVVFYNQKGNRFSQGELPKEAQFTKVYSVLTNDFDGDGNLDVVMGGNQARSKPEMGIYNATYGLLFENSGDQSMNYVKPSKSGIFVRGEVRDIFNITVGDTSHLVFLRNSDKVKSFVVNKR